MGMSTNIIGFKPTDAKWKRMKTVWDTCKENDIKPPKEVSEFFEWCEPDDSGVAVEIEHSEAVNDYAGGTGEGFEVDISKLPKDIKIIRFYNSW